MSEQRASIGGVACQRLTLSRLMFEAVNSSRQHRIAFRKG
jgi:hypothetical protein